MKKLFTLLAAVSVTTVWVYAYTEHNIQSANFLATKGVINDNSTNVIDYNLGYHITRREMLKVMMNLSDVTVPNNCNGSFSDMSSSDWGCKYAEAALGAGFIAANTNFRPDDNVTLIEALKMVMQAKWIVRDDNSDWRAGYESKAKSEDLIDQWYLEYDLKATRWWIFSTSARSYEDFIYTEPEVEVEPEIEELFKSLLDL